MFAESVLASRLASKGWSNVLWTITLLRAAEELRRPFAILVDVLSVWRPIKRRHFGCTPGPDRRDA